MKRYILFLFLAATFIGHSYGQRKVLLEDFTGAFCANCPLGSYFVDSMATLYPDLITVSLHTYGIPDSMFFPTIDTIGQAYALGAPLAAIDRIYHAGGTAIYLTQWNNNILQRLTAPPKLDVTLSSTWDNATRDITATMNVNILSDLDSGDYRISLYIVEDSVAHSGPGYDQENIFNQVIGSPFYGLGDPIPGYVHRHVVRALLPYAWGLAGVVPATALSGQNFAHVFHYTLPENYNENKVSLVAFVSSYTADHHGDSVLNAANEKLNIPLAANVISTVDNNFEIYPNPARDRMIFSSADVKSYSLLIYNALGQVVMQRDFKGRAEITRNELGNGGLYYARILQGREQRMALPIMFLQ